MEDRIVAFVPAYNEGEHGPLWKRAINRISEGFLGYAAFEDSWSRSGELKSVLRALTRAKRAGLIDDLIVVDDGSVDNTAEIALKALGGRDTGKTSTDEWTGGVEHTLADGTLITHPHNMGKSEAFKTAAVWCRRREATIISMTDADMKNLTPNRLARFLDRIRGDGHVQMATAGYEQTYSLVTAYTCPHTFSGFRAVRLEALEPFFALERDAWMRLNESFSLELALEDMIEDRRTVRVDGLGLRSRGGAMGSSPKTTIDEGVDHANAVKVMSSRRRYLEHRIGELMKAEPDSPLVSEFRRLPTDEVRGGIHMTVQNMSSGECFRRIDEIDGILQGLKARERGRRGTDRGPGVNRNG